MSDTKYPGSPGSAPQTPQSSSSLNGLPTMALSQQMRRHSVFQVPRQEDLDLSLYELIPGPQIKLEFEGDDEHDGVRLLSPLSDRPDTLELLERLAEQAEIARDVHDQLAAEVRRVGHLELNIRNIDAEIRLHVARLMVEQEELLQQEAQRQYHELLHQERLQQERLQQERLQQERLQQERLQQERLQQERLQQERLQQERLQEEREREQRILEDYSLTGRQTAEYKLLVQGQFKRFLAHWVPQFQQQANPIAHPHQVNPELRNTQRDYSRRIEPLIHALTRENHRDYPTSLMKFHLLSSDQLDSLALHFDQVYPPRPLLNY